MTFPARAHYLTEPLTADDQRPLVFGPHMIDSLPTEIRSLTGAVRSAWSLHQGGCYALAAVEAQHGTFVVKIARGDYRSQELWAEHAAMQLLHNSPVPVPQPLAFTRQGDLSFQLRSYSPGEPLTAVMEADGNTRSDAIREMGGLLASIHAVSVVGDWTWNQWITAGLEQASRNLAAGVCDPDEFTRDEPPDDALDWLLANRPTGGGSTCLLHGDFRPKNVLWQNGGITGLIDWQFADVGDPYYDLSIIHWYMRDEAEWSRFLDAYGLGEFDRQRFEYCLVLQKFLNV